MSSFTSKYKSTPTFSFKSKNRSITSYNDPSNLPSPQQYNPQKISIKKSPSSKFPKSIRKQWEQIKSTKDVPGPGAFQPHSFTTDGPKKTISKVLFHKIISQTPSPGFYKDNSIVLFKKQPSFTFQKRTISMHNLINQKNKDKPAPGTYQQPIIKFKSSSTITLPKSKRNSVVLNEKNPGPGFYQTEKSFNSSIMSESKCKIGKQKRKIDFSMQQPVPGPGSYQRKSFFQDNKLKHKGYSCRSKFLIQSPNARVPGPGSYQTPTIRSNKSAPHIKMPKSKRFSFTDVSINIHKNIPGPGSFDLQGIDRNKFRSMSVHKFSKSQKNYLSQSINSQSSKKLGPGFYNLNEKFNQKSQPKYSIGKNKTKGLFINIQKLPGPGDYNPKTSLVHQSQFNYKMQKSDRSNAIKHLIQNPGPGNYQYNITQRLGRNFKFSKQKRQHIFDSKASKLKFHEQNNIYQPRQQFPNPPKYMSVIPKIKFNEKAMKNQ